MRGGPADTYALRGRRGRAWLPADRPRQTKPDYCVILIGGEVAVRSTAVPFSVHVLCSRTGRIVIVVIAGVIAYFAKRRKAV